MRRRRAEKEGRTGLGDGLRLGRRSLRKALLRPGLRLSGAAFLLASCGIPSTGVVEAGEGANGIAPTRILFFVRREALVAVRQQTPDVPTVASAVEALFLGPEAEFRNDGMLTALPRLESAPTVRTNGATATVRLPRGTDRLSGQALAQLTCTVEYAVLAASTDIRSPSAAKVTVTVPGGWSAGESGEACPEPDQAEPDAAPEATEAATPAEPTEAAEPRP